LVAADLQEGIAMMGRRGGTQDKLFYCFNLDDHVPRGHLLRGIDEVLDLGDLRKHLAPFYSHTGRPSIDPELMIRMLVVGYCFGIRSERRLCEEVQLNLAYRWFCRLDLEASVPDHSTFSKNRHGRFRQSDVFRHLFESVLRRCMSEGLVGGEGFAIDASVVKADANRLEVFLEPRHQCCRTLSPAVLYASTSMRSMQATPLATTARSAYLSPARTSR
jgi:transposase